MDTTGNTRKNGKPLILHVTSIDVLQLMVEVSHNAVQLPRLLGVYPVSPHFSEFANSWRSYGSVKQLQV